MELGSQWQDYVPLLVVLLFAVLASAALQANGFTGWNGRRWMGDFMGLFLVIFSMFKFFDPAGFADGFQRYDLLAGSFRPYALLYPFIELSLGLAYLAGWRPVGVAIATIAVMLFGALGVIRALGRGADLACACMGTVLRVPLSVVALVEDLGMAGMAALMLIFPAPPGAPLILAN